MRRLINTVVLAAATTHRLRCVDRHHCRAVPAAARDSQAAPCLVAMLTFPLAFPGVVVGFMVILLAGRQGLIGEISRQVAGREDRVRLLDARACFSATSISRSRA